MVKKNVYIVSLGFDNLYKIGFTKKYVKRYVAEKLAWNPKLDIVYFKSVYYAHWCEQALHSRLTNAETRYTDDSSREVFILNEKRLEAAIQFIEDWDISFAGLDELKEYEKTLKKLTENLPTKTRSSPVW